MADDASEPYRVLHRRQEYRINLVVYIAFGVLAWGTATAFAVPWYKPWYVFSLFFSWRVLFVALMLWFCLALVGSAKILQVGLWQPRQESMIMELTAAVKNLDHWLVMALYGGTSIFLVRLYFAQLVNDVQSLELFTYPPGYRTLAREMNHEMLFMTYFAALLGISYSFRRLLLDRNVLQINMIQPPTVVVVYQNLGGMLMRSLHYTFHVLLPAYVSFMLFSRVYYSLAAHLTAMVFGHILVTPVIGFHWYNVLFLYRVYTGGVFAVFAWEIVDCLVNSALAKVHDIALATPAPFTCMVNGITDTSHRNARSMALAELAKMAAKHPDARKKLYLTVQPTNAWHDVSRALIAILTDLRTRIEQEYKADTDASKSGKYVLRPYQEKQPQPPIFATVQLKEDESIFRSAYNDELDQLDENSNNVDTLDDRFTAFDTGVDDDTGAQPTEPFLPDNRGTAYVAHRARKIVAHVKHHKIVRRLFNVTIQQKMRVFFENAPDLIHAVQGLSALVVASTKEDVYGYVQHDIALVLSTLMDALEDVKHFCATPPKAYASLPRDSSRVRESIMVIRALETAVYGIAETFRDHFDFILLDKKHRHALEQYL